MAPLLSPSREVEPVEELPGDHPTKKSRRKLLAGTLLFVATLAILAAGGWGLLSALGAQAPPARVGDTIEIAGGSLRVDEVTPESMAPMRLKSFGKAGMNMSDTMGMSMAPEGFERFTVDVTLVAQNSDLNYSARDFRLTGDGMEETGPVRNALTGESVPTGSAASGALIFQAPEGTKNLMLIFGNSRQPVALDLPENGGHSHDH